MSAKSLPLLAAVEEVLEQGRALLDAVTPETYRKELPGAAGGTIGAHYRHVLDHFQCLLEGIRTSEINYDRRRRSPAIEASPAAAFVATELLQEELSRLSGTVLDQECNVVYSVGYAAEQAAAVRTNVAREVMFCVGHAIHHYAILKLLCASHAVGLPYEFGVAPSTLKHLEARASSTP